MTIKVFRPIVLTALAALISLPAQAQEKPQNEQADILSWLVGFQSGDGGDPVGPLVVDGSDKGDADAGAGMHFYGGVIYRPYEQLETRITAGYYFDRSKTDTGTVFIDRIVAELIPTFAHGNHRFGVGGSYHANPTLDGEDFEKEDVEFDDALGLVAEYGYKVAPFLYFGFRYVIMDYEISTTGVTLDGKRTLDANHYGLNLYFQF